MNVEKLVPFNEGKQRSDAKQLTLRDVLATVNDVALAGKDELEAILSSPEEAISLLLEESESDYCPAILFCGNILLHENGSEYVDALCLKNRATLVVEKYWLNDPMLPSFVFAVAE